MESIFVLVSVLLFLIGCFGFITRKNAIVAFMCLELMLNGINVALVTFSKFHNNYDGQILTLFVIAVAAAEAAVGLGIILSLFRSFRSIETSAASEMRG